MRAMEPFRDRIGSRWEDTLRLEIAQLERQVEDASQRLDLVRVIHAPTAYWEGEWGEVDIENVEPTGYICLICSDNHVEWDLENWELDSTDGSVVFWPCETYQATTKENQ